MAHSPDAEIYQAELKSLLEKAPSRRELYQAIVDAPFHNPAMTARLGLGIIVLLLINPETGTIDRIALAKTELAQGTEDMSAIPFSEIKIPTGDRNNYIAIAIRRRHYMMTSDWQYLFTPALTTEEAHLNQAGGGIACSVVYPLNDLPAGGALIFSYYEQPERIGKPHHQFMQEYARLVSGRLAKI